VDRHNVIHTRDGGTVQANLPAGVVINQVQRVRGGWVIAYLDAIPRFGLVTPDGVLHPIEGFGQDLLGVSPDGTLVAVREARDLVRVDELPGLDTVANLRLGPEAMANNLGEAHFIGDEAVLINSGNLGDSSGQWSVLSGWNWRTGNALTQEKRRVVTTFGKFAVVGDDWDVPTYDVMSVEPSMVMRRTGCLPNGRWSLSPDGKWLAAPCLSGDCVRLLQLDDVLAGRTPTMRVITVPGHPGRAYFADTGELLITVELPPEPDAPAWGLLRCTFTPVCTRATFAQGPTAAVVDVGLIQT
jgi:hypothetical protein